MWREEGITSGFDGPELPVRWRVPISNGYSGPTVADGRVYVTDRVTEPDQAERVHCFDAMTGERIWSHTYSCAYDGISHRNGPRAAVTIAKSRAYSLGATGHLHCFDAATRKVLWARDLRTQYRIRMPEWGIAAAPLTEGGLVIVLIGGEGACLAAFDRVTGREVWRALNDRAGYAAPIVIHQAGRRMLVAWTGERVVGLDPTSGKLLWEHPYPAARMIHNVAPPVFRDGHLLLSGFFDGSLVLKVASDEFAVTGLWQRRGPNERNTDSLHCCIAAPIVADGHIYGIDSYGELRCLNLDTGERVWESLDVVPRARWATAHLIPNGDKVWMFTERGELIISELSPKGFREISRAKLVEPTTGQLNQREGVCWAPPAFAGRHIYVRNDEALVCADLSSDGTEPAEGQSLHPPVQEWFPVAPPLGPPQGEIITVSNVQGLINAIEDAEASQTILVADGHYLMPRYVEIRADGVTLRGASGCRERVILDAVGSQHGELLGVRGCSGVTIADLTIQNVRWNGFKINSETGVQELTIRNCIIHNIWQRGVKGVKVPLGNREALRPKRCCIEYCLFYNDRPKRLSDDAADIAQGNYIAGIDVMYAKDWLISDNVFVGIQGRTGEGRGAIFLWFDAQDCVVERNTIIDCDVGLQLGNPHRADGVEHHCV
ncbi:MAG: outer membrane protein assembly factor BamB family protein, partial [Planctomycetota bacterium]